MGEDIVCALLRGRGCVTPVELSELIKFNIIIGNNIKDVSVIPNIVDLSGKRYGRLTVVSRVDDHITPSGRHHLKWKCICDCGNEIVTRGDALKDGRTQSCGCVRSEVAHKRASTHGESKSKLYGVWSAMKSRCYNPNSPHYDDYGGRGITVCLEWREYYEKFKYWAVNNGYSEGLTIDRIDVNGGYCPENCRWVGSVAQANNRRSNRIYTYNNETHNIMEWSQIYHIPYKTLHNRLYSGWDIERALTT